MAEAAIPVDLFNPGQVFACLGFLEAADLLLGDAEGGFDWSNEPNTFFALQAGDERNPFEVVLEFLAEIEPIRLVPVGYADPPSKKSKAGGDDEAEDNDADEEAAVAPAVHLSASFPARQGDRMALPIRFGGGNRPVVDLGHWADGSSRESFKLYAGNRSADRIARAMLQGVHKKPTRRQKANGTSGDLVTRGLAQLWDTERAELVQTPFHRLTAMGGSFNFDPRGAWTAIDAGYSPNEHKHPVEASPVVEFLAAWGLEHARPMIASGTRHVRYAAWGKRLPPILARAALSGSIEAIPLRRFHFDLNLSGKNKVVTFAREEPFR